MTAKAEGLWDPLPALPGLMPVSRVDIQHMQRWVHQFTAIAPLPHQDLVAVPACKETFCRWLVADAAEAAVGQVERPIRRLAGRAPPALPGGAGAEAEGEELVFL